MVALIEKVLSVSDSLFQSTFSGDILKRNH